MRIETTVSILPAPTSPSKEPRSLLTSRKSIPSETARTTGFPPTTPAYGWTSGTRPTRTSLRGNSTPSSIATSTGIPSIHLPPTVSLLHRLTTALITRSRSTKMANPYPSERCCATASPVTSWPWLAFTTITTGTRPSAGTTRAVVPAMRMEDSPVQAPAIVKSSTCRAIPSQALETSSTRR